MTEHLSDARMLEVQAVDHAIGDLAAVLGPRQQPLPHVEGGLPEDVLFEACSLVGTALGITIRRPSPSLAASGLSPLNRIARASRTCVRRVVLDDGWWRGDAGPLLGSRKDGRSVALLPTSPGRYRLVDVVEGRDVPITAAVAAELDLQAFQFYRTLPERAVAPRDLVAFALAFVRRDVAWMLLTGVLASLLALAIPVGLGLLVNRILPAGQRAQVLNLGLGLLLATSCQAVYRLVESFAILRIEGRVDADLQPAVLWRLLNLPARFFRGYSSADLGLRALGVNRIRSLLAGSSLPALAGAVFSVFSLLLLFYYDVTLALVALALVVIMMGVTAWSTYLQVRQQQRLVGLDASLADRVVALLQGVAKIRVAAAEGRAFQQWAVPFARQRALTLENRLLNVHLGAFNQAWPVLTTMLFIAWIAGTGYRMDDGSVLAFFGAFGQFQAAMLSLDGVLVSLLLVGPLARRLAPILKAIPETQGDRPDPGVLEGSLRVENVSFRYRSDGPLVLEDVSLEARPGEFVAVVGPSGTGKSTLLRLLLGFESPEQGAVYFDGRDLAQVDVQAVRRQIGTVLQDGRLLPGDIQANILGSSLLAEDDAWEAARLAGMAGEIEALPMGMKTQIVEGSSTFSGGQRQRLLLARAVVGGPRYLLLDEATSYLDAATQEEVTRNLEQMEVTRVVIAHRLSTIRNADRIYVLSNGRVAQVGRYEELLAQDGPFRELARRQVT